MMECASSSNSASLARAPRARFFKPVYKSVGRGSRVFGRRPRRWRPLAGRRASVRLDHPARFDGAASLLRRPRSRVVDAATGAAGGATKTRRVRGDESETGEREIVVVDGEAVVLEEDERAARRLGWDIAMSRVTVLQLATCAATSVAEPLLGTIDAYWVASPAPPRSPPSAPTPASTAPSSPSSPPTASHRLPRLIAVALEKDERARREGTLKRGEPTLAGASIIAVAATAVSFGALCALGIAMFPEAVVRVVGVDASVIQTASGYMRVRAMGVPAVCLIAVLGGAFQAARDAGTPLFAVLLAGTTKNLILDPSLIFLFKMGFQGAAWATVVAQYAEATLMFWFAFRGPRRAQLFRIRARMSARERTKTPRSWTSCPFRVRGGYTAVVEVYPRGGVDARAGGERGGGVGGDVGAGGASECSRAPRTFSSSRSSPSSPSPRGRSSRWPTRCARGCRCPRETRRRAGRGGR